MNTGIYLIKEGDRLLEMSEQPYQSEAVLQELLAKHPNILAGNLIDSSVPRRWLLISRELGLPDEENAADRWSVDHLFLDQDGIPTIVEVKRSSDSRIRREVVGQMLDYAANAIRYWPIETIRSKFEAQLDAQGIDPDQTLSEFLGTDSDIEQFWQKVKTNLQAGKLRLVFVADEIPTELKRIVEYLNSQMDPTEVLAVEIKRYSGNGLTTLVPRIFGQTAEAQQKKSVTSSETRQWDERSFFGELQRRHGSDATVIARKILDWAHVNGQVWWGQGARSGSFVPFFTHKGTDHPLFAVWTYGRVEIYFYWYTRRAPFDSDLKKKELLSKLNAIAGINLPDDAINKRPGIPISAFTADDALKSFFEIFEWFINEVKST